MSSENTIFSVNHESEFALFVPQMNETFSVVF